MLSEAVKKKFPDYTTQAIGGYFFLRFLCPALSTKPHAYGMLDPALATSQNLRNFLLISKVLQVTSLCDKIHPCRTCLIECYLEKRRSL